MLSDNLMAILMRKWTVFNEMSSIVASSGPALTIVTLSISDRDSTSIELYTIRHFYASPTSNMNITYPPPSQELYENKDPIQRAVHRLQDEVDTMVDVYHQVRRQGQG